ncbi:MAG: hypothetical protein KDK99_01525 [Verrucomicrobiales bacterium]|nr:hypothetical protein [Verrucomicrobiales bacterium]
MNYTVVRKLLLKVSIAVLSLTALVAILAVLGGKFGDTQFKVLVTTFSITAGSIGAMSCAAFIEKRKAKAIGVIGILVAGVAVALVIVSVWGRNCGDEYWKTTVTFIVLAIAFAHACLLYLPTLAASYRWTQPASTFLIGLLALQILVAVWGKIDDEGYYRSMAALSVLVVLATLVVTICGRLGAKADNNRPEPGPDAAGSSETPEQLVLHRLSNGTFEDQLGGQYQVTRIEAQPSR